MFTYITGCNESGGSGNVTTATGTTTGGNSGTGNGNTGNDEPGDNPGDEPGDEPIVDFDNDGYLSDVDCNDFDATINPGAADTCGDYIDQNCDGADANCDYRQQHIGGIPFYADETGDGGFIMFGPAYTLDENGEPCGSTVTETCRPYTTLRKLDRNGNEEWLKDLGQLQASYLSKSFDTNGNHDGYVMFKRNTIYRPVHHIMCHLYKIDLDGNFLWETDEGVLAEYVGKTLRGLIPTSDGGYVLIFLPDHIIKFAPSIDGQPPEIQWEKDFEIDYGLYVFLEDVVESDDNGYVLAGQICPDEKEGEPVINNAVLIAKINNDGSFGWFNYDGDEKYDYTKSIDKTDNGYLIMANRGRIYKADLNGEFQWVTVHPAISTPRSIKHTSDGGAIAAGECFTGYVTNRPPIDIDYPYPGYGNSDIGIVKISADGSIEWENIFGRNYIDRPYNLFEVDDGTGYMIFAMSRTISDMNFANKTMVIRTNSNGQTYRKYYFDGDGDGFGYIESSVMSDTKPDGYAYNPDDCDDTDPEKFPGADDPLGDGIDQNCDGFDG